MNRRKVIILGTLLLGLVFLMSGCIVRSVNPLYTTDTLVYKPELNGVWVGEDSDPEDGSLTFYHEGGKSYRMILTDSDGTESIFTAHLLELDGRLYLDLYPDELDEVDERYLSHLIPMHSFYLITIEGYVLTLRELKYSKIEELIEQGLLDVPHVIPDEEAYIALTGATAELQRFITERNTEIFEDEVNAEVMKKIK